ncbi:MAG TPA: arginine deiminase-related protein [Puia sp.]|nr:arginine deiminase-related protein [Puia sp.]
MQTTSHLLMIRPVNFSFNPQTAVNNSFQTPGKEADVQRQALNEFEGFVRLLRDNEVDVTVIDDTPEPYTPDSIFPNNWVSFHEDGSVCLYPMYAVNRRQERKPGVLQKVGRQFRIADIFDLSGYEREGLFLEGTGSMVLDREAKIAYACNSPRTNSIVLHQFCSRLGYTQLTFTAVDALGRDIYHTNVMMCVADRYVVVCLDALPYLPERTRLTDTIRASDKTIIPITLDQMSHFAGNMLQVHNRRGEKLLVMSSQAFESLDPEQILQLTSFNRILHAPLTTIETNGGGSARCMLAEIHLEPIK